MLKKLMITPYFGELPAWFDLWKANFDRLKPLGYDLLMETDLDDFRQRCSAYLGVNCSITPGNRKFSDYRPALGKLYQDEISGYDFYGHTDFDCCYGRIDHFATEQMLNGLDLHSNHHCYMCGPWSLYRNCDKVKKLFEEYPGWRDELENPNSLGWGEKEYSQIVDKHAAAGDIRLKYTHWQSNNPDITENLRWVGDALYDGHKEIMMAHFNRTKVYPHALQSRN